MARRKHPRVAEGNPTIVSPDVVETNETVETAPITAAGERVVLVPMAEWKQSAQRGVRTFFQAFAFLAGGGTIYQALAQVGIPPASVANLPSTGSALFDAVCYALVFALLVFLWNFLEFALDIDLKAPKWRA